KEKDRARPVLATVTGIFDSGYAQLDRYLAYVDYSLVGGDGEWEILLSPDDDTEERAQELWDQGIWAETYQDRYSSLYLNVRQSVTILYVILVAVALLAAFFSTDIAHVYITRDSRDIAGLRLMGMKEKDIRHIYTFLTLRSVAVSSLMGIAVGIILGLFSPSLVRFVSFFDPGLMEYYIASFDTKVPWLEISGMYGAMLILSFLTVAITLRRSGKDELPHILSES
ncbi:MAG: ABC transporter permease, partial [Candidatus Ornithospirochaeta sp.]